MPEGPSLVILKEEVAQFRGKKIISVSGNSSLDIARMEGQKIIDFKTWGKHFLICLQDFSVRIHFLMFGRYAINDTRPSKLRVGMKFSKGEFNLYNCAVQFIEEPLDAVYEWSADVMNDEWDEKGPRKN